MRNYILSETNWMSVREIGFELAILPWGATEAHNLHLPYGTDNYIADYLAAESAKIAWNSGAKVIVLPTLPYGVNTGQPDVELDMNINPSTQFFILKDLITVLNRQKVNKLVILNTHGGNDFKQMIRELNLLFPEMFICQCDWFRIPGAENHFSDLGEHAGEVETSFMQFLHPGLVRSLSEAGDGKALRFKLQAINQRWVWAERKWTQVTRDTGIGNPAEASASKGETFLNIVTDKIAEFFCELAKTPVDQMYH